MQLLQSRGDGGPGGRNRSWPFEAMHPKLGDAGDAEGAVARWAAGTQWQRLVHDRHGNGFQVNTPGGAILLGEWLPIFHLPMDRRLRWQLKLLPPDGDQRLAAFRHCTWTNGFSAWPCMYGQKSTGHP